jgi:hypothetical protein
LLTIVDDFVGILLSVEIKEASTITMICEDALGGQSTIDSRKFANEFIKRRQADIAGVPYSGPTDTFVTSNLKANEDNNGWTSVVGSGLRSSLTQVEPIITIASENKFAVVGKYSKKKKNKK